MNLVPSDEDSDNDYEPPVPAGRATDIAPLKGIWDVPARTTFVSALRLGLGAGSGVVVVYLATMLLAFWLIMGKLTFIGYLHFAFSWTTNNNVPQAPQAKPQINVNVPPAPKEELVIFRTKEGPLKYFYFNPSKTMDALLRFAPDAADRLEEVYGGVYRLEAGTAAVLKWDELKECLNCEVREK